MRDLGLQSEAQKHFGFLVAECGYRCTASNPHWVDFESEEVIIILSFDGNRSYELDLTIGKKSFERIGYPFFSLHEILLFRRVHDAKRFSLIQVTSQKVLALFVEEMARMLRTYGADFIAGNTNSFDALLGQRETELERHARESILQTARIEAETAWRQKDYRKVVVLLSPHRAALSATEVGKLEFAEKRH